MNTELRPGYKLTEVGVIPEDWSIKRLGDLAIVGSGGTPSREKAAYWNGLIPWVTTSQIDFNTITCADQFITGEGLQNSAAKLLPAGTLLMALYGQGKTRGKVGVLGIEAATNQACASISLTEGISREFALHFLASRYESIRNSSNTGGQENLNGQIVKDTPVVLPPISEQRAIAAALSDMDALISGLDQLIAKKRDIKQAAMQQLLTGQQRLPGFSGEWEVKTLFEIAERKKELFDDGDWIESEHITNQGVRLIQTGNIGVGKFIEKDVRKYIYDKSFTSLRCKELRRGDLLLCRLADPAGRACVLPDIGEEKIVTSVDVTIFRPSIDTADRVYLSNLFSTPEWFRAVSDRSGGTTHKRISRGALGRISIKIPPVKEQTAIATILSDMDSELATLETRRDKACQLKQGMMQELLTGRIRLSY